MRFTLKDYQADAVSDVLTRLGQARELYHSRFASRSAFSLSATTGAGKTVMAAAVIEALFEGNDDYDFQADPGAVVLWFTDDPSLNAQTKFRLLEASDLPAARLKVIEPEFHADRLEPGMVYFLNTQKLGRNSLLVRGAQTGDDETLPTMPAAPDLRANTMWDILRNTIEDPRLTLYLILDEAHKGMKSTARLANEKQTIVRRLINGEGGAPAMPIVWGISATVHRFETAMAAAVDRIGLPPVAVDPARVQESGLLKDDIRLDFPTEAGRFDTVLLTRATRRVQEASRLWTEYAASQDPPIDPVAPLLVVQLPNTPSDDLLLEAFHAVRDAWPDLPSEAMAHVFGEHKTIELGGFTVPHIAPEKVQESTWVRVLFAKDAISTGWDCPRAEVLMSFRPAEDQTHITQLLGRMVRTPLARRIPGNDRLNSVECVLPRFNRSTATAVGELLLGHGDAESGGSGGGGGRRVQYAPVDLVPNDEVPALVWEVYDALPSQTLPRKAGRPPRQLLSLAQALSQDGIRAGARSQAYDELCGVLAGFAARRRRDVDRAREGILRMSGETVVVGPSGMITGELFTEASDEPAIEAAFAAASRVLTKDIALRYAEHVAADDPDDPDEGLLDAHLHVASLARVEGVADELDREATALADRWYAEHRVDIKGLADERRAAYEEILAMAPEPRRTDVLRPKVQTASSEDSNGNMLPTVDRHLMSTASGARPVDDLNDWERLVLDHELSRPDSVAWYRNPSRASADSLAIAYQDAQGAWRRMCPDFLFFQRVGGTVRISIVDPHGTHLRDALPKLRGLAKYTGEYGELFHRIEAVAEVDGRLRVLDLQQEAVRAAVAEATDAEELYRSAAVDY